MLWGWLISGPDRPYQRINKPLTRPDCCRREGDKIRLALMNDARGGRGRTARAGRILVSSGAVRDGHGASAELHLIRGMKAMAVRDLI